MRTRCPNEASWATRPCPPVAGHDFGFRTRGPKGLWPGACSGTAEARGDSGLRGHTPQPLLPPSAPPTGWSAPHSAEVRGTQRNPEEPFGQAGNTPWGDPTSPGSPTAASQDPMVPRPPAEGSGMLGWYQAPPPPGPTCGSGTWPSSRKPLPTLVFPRSRWLLGGRGRCVGRYPPTHQSPASS